MALIKVVPWVCQVFKRSYFTQLGHIVDHWVDEADKHQPAQGCAMFVISVEVDQVDIGSEDDDIHEMDEGSKVMNVLGEAVPHELKVVLYHLAPKDLLVLSFPDDLHKIVEQQTFTILVAGARK